MTDAETTLVARWQAWYQNFSNSRPGCFSEKLSPTILEINLERRELLMEFHTADWMANPMGITHGGVIASMVDIAAGILSIVLINADTGTPTVHLSVDYLRPVALDRTLWLRAACPKTGRLLNYTTCTGFYPESPAEALFTAEGIYFAAASRSA